MAEDTQNQPIIELRKIVKTFGKVRALDGFDLTVRQGEIHGFLGPNGAGKSTAIRVILGLLKKTSGDALLFGEDPWKHAVSLHKRLAYVPGDVNFWPNLTGGEIIDLLGDLRGGISAEKRQSLLERFELDPTKKFRTYSKGNKQKVALVAALASDVELYIFDEPTSGLDPLMEAHFQDVVKDLAARNKTILLSSHILAEVEALCDQVTIIREGVAVENGTLADLQKLHRSTMAIETTDTIMAPLSEFEGVHAVTATSHGLQFDVDRERVDAVLKFLAGYTITNITSRPPTLETLFLKHYEDSEES